MAETIDSTREPERATAAAGAFLARVHGDEADSLPDTPPSAPTLPDFQVALPGGLWSPGGAVARTAEVRELDGDDEEHIAKAGTNFAKMLDTVLQRGVVRVGEETADKATLDRLLAGDRDTLLLAIRKATFGEKLEFQPMPCPHCREENEITVDLSADVPSRKLDDPADAEFDLSLKTGKSVQVSLPDGTTQRELASSEERTAAALNTILLANCVKKIDYVPVVSPQQVRALKIRERQEILDAISERTPGPRLGEVTRPCSECGKDISVPLSMVALFLG